MEAGIVVYKDFYLFAFAVEGVAGGCIGQSRGVGAGEGGFLHVAGTVEKGSDIEAGDGDGQQAHRSEHRVAATHIVGDDKSLVALCGGEAAQSAAVFVGDGDNEFSGLLAAGLFLQLFAQQAEGYGRLSGCAALGYHYDAEFLVLKESLKLGEIILAYVLAGKENFRALGGHICGKRVAQCFYHCLGTQIAAADADGDNIIAGLAQSVCCGVDIVDEGGVGFARQFYPT